MIIAKANPVGIDKVIDTIQTALFDGLMTNGPFTDYTVYHRAYQNESDEGIKAERYTNSNEYRDVFLDDKQNLSSFFIVDDDRPADTLDSLTANVSVIFQARLDKLYNNITERADEELNREIYFILNDLRSQGITFVNFVQGISNVYAEFDQSKIKWTDMHPLYVVRFNLEVRNSFDCAIVVDGPPPACGLSVLVTVENETSLGANDGTAIATPSGEVGGIIFSWTGPSGFTSSEQGIIGLAAGVYTVITRDIGVASCTATDSGTVSSDGVGCAISIDEIITTAPTVFGGNDGEALAVVTGNAGPIQYKWVDDQVTNPAVGLSAGAICVAVLDTDVDNCQDIAIAVIPIPIAITLTTRKDSDVTLTIIYSGTGQPEWTSVSVIDGTQIELGLGPTFNYSTIEDHDISIKVDEPDKLTAISADWTSDKITKFNAQALPDFGDSFNVNSNDIIEIINPVASTRPYTKYDVANNEFVTNDMTGIILSDIVILSNCVNATSMPHGVSALLVSSYKVNNCTSLVNHSVANLNIGTIFWVNNSSNLETLDFGTGNNNTFLDLRLQVTKLAFVDLTIFPNLLKRDNHFSRVYSMGMDVGQVNHMYVNFLALASTETPFEFSGRTIRTGTSDPEPDNGSGGFQGLDAVDELVDDFGFVIII